MRDLEQVPFHDTSEKLVKVLCDATQNSNPMFFRVLVAYYFAKVASMMRVSIQGPTGEIPVNLYAINLATSGFGKGRSTGIIEKQVINQFKANYLENTFPTLAEEQIKILADKRAMRDGTDPDDELASVRREFNSCGPLLFSFSEGTSPAVKQLRQKFLIAKAGSFNFEIDEIGSNLTANMELFTAFLELYDHGDTKPKLVKNTSENQRGEEIFGGTPANLMAFGTAAKLLDGGKTENEFMSLLDTGYARRSMFGFAKGSAQDYDKSPEEVYDQMVTSYSTPFLDDLSEHLGALADLVNFDKKIQLSREVGIQWAEYLQYCGRRSEDIPEHEEARKAEVKNRYFKTLKLAGAYAFIDGSHEITEAHLYNAIKLAEESGKAFEQLMSRDQPYVRLARYLADTRTELTQADLVQNLPYYKGNNSARAEMLTLATAWGYKHNVIIKKSFMDGIEFLRGESLQETNLDEVTLCYGEHVAYSFRNEQVPFDKLHMLTQHNGFHWVAHHVKEGHRCEEKTIPGFNLVVIDVDGGCTLDTAKLLLKDYRAHYYTTKRHTAQEHRFRIILPINYTLKLDADDYKEFMQSVFEWLPFEVDEAAGQRARKWLSHAGHYEYTDGKMLDALPFIPKTRKAEERKARVLEQSNLTNLERWFVNNTGTGNRSNQLIKYALILVDAGHDMTQCRQGVMDLNDKLADKLTADEIDNTIMRTVGQTIAKREAAAA